MLPFEVHALILKNLPAIIPDYNSIAKRTAHNVKINPGWVNRHISFGSDGTVWAPDTYNHVVHNFKLSGELIKTIGTGTAGDGPGELRDLVGIAASRLSSSVFVGEHGNNRISEFNQNDGEFLKVLDTPGLSKPYGIRLSPDETSLAVACSYSDCIRAPIRIGKRLPKTIPINSKGEQWAFPARGRGGGEFYFPVDICFTPDGQDLVVADYNNHRVQVVDATDGTFVREIPLRDEVFAIAVDSCGNIVVATKHVQVFSPEGKLLHKRLGRVELKRSKYGIGGQPVCLGHRPIQWQNDLCRRGHQDRGRSRCDVSTSITRYYTALLKFPERRVLELN